MRLAAKRDGNEQYIIDALEGDGFIVQSISDTGIPDLLVGHPKSKRLFMIEVKDTGGRLKPAQKEFHAKFAGFPVYVAFTVEAALLIARSQ